MTDVPKPIRPTITPVNRPFWEGCARGELVIQRCSACARLRYPAGAVCPDCLSPDAAWECVSGAGKVFSFIVFHRAYHPAWESKVPYSVALIELDEGPIMLSNVVDVDPVTLAVGQTVKVAFERLDQDLTIPVFKPA
jgi:uncharacterized OB-fold protein